MSSLPPLSSLINDSLCDIQIAHSYVPVYDELFTPIRNDSLNILQIGVEHGAMLQTWVNYFPNAKVYGIDTAPQDGYDRHAFFREQVTMYGGADYINQDFVNEKFVNQGITFDIIIDDCSPRDLHVISATVQLYLPLVKNGGMYFSEDLKYVEWGNELTQSIPEELQPNAVTLDRRSISQGYDDILWYVTK